jgi:hypothetical protein
MKQAQAARAAQAAQARLAAALAREAQVALALVQAPERLVLLPGRLESLA